MIGLAKKALEESENEEKEKEAIKENPEKEAEADESVKSEDAGKSEESVKTEAVNEETTDGSVEAPKPEPVVKPVETVQPATQPVPDPVPQEIASIFTCALKDIVSDMTEKNTAMIERMMKLSEDKTLSILDKCMEDRRNVPEVKVVSEPQKQETSITEAPKAEPVKPATVPETTASQTEDPVTPSFPMTSGIDGVMRMILMPDGSLIPVHIERTQKKKNKGLFGFAGRIFGKDSKQNALLQQLIDEKLNSDQISMIKRAVKSRLSDTEVKDLINCNLSATEMNGLIDVVIADRQARMGVM